MKSNFKCRSLSLTDCVIITVMSEKSIVISLPPQLFSYLRVYINKRASRRIVKK